MATVKIRATSLAFLPDEPEREFHITAKGTAEHVESIESDMPDWAQMQIEFVMNERSVTMEPTFYHPAPGSMLNFISTMERYWYDYPDKIAFDVEGDIGTIPCKKGVQY